MLVAVVFICRRINQPNIYLSLVDDPKFVVLLFSVYGILGILYGSLGCSIR